MGGSFTTAEGDEAHGEGAEGTVQGPVAFLWPEDRPWSAAADNAGPCGSATGVINRTNFPLCKRACYLSHSVIDITDFTLPHKLRDQLPSLLRTRLGMSPSPSPMQMVSF